MPLHTAWGSDGVRWVPTRWGLPLSASDLMDQVTTPPPSSSQMNYFLASRPEPMLRVLSAETEPLLGALFAILNIDPSLERLGYEYKRLYSISTTFTTFGAHIYATFGGTPFLPFFFSSSCTQQCSVLFYSFITFWGTLSFSRPCRQTRFKFC